MNLKYFVPLLILSITLFILSDMENLNINNEKIWFLDKIVHLIAYLFYGLTLQYAFINKDYISKKRVRTNILIIFLGTIFAITDEIHQYYVPTRHFDYWDIVFDVIGVIISLIFSRRIYNFKFRRG